MQLTYYLDFVIKETLVPYTRYHIHDTPHDTAQSSHQPLVSTQAADDGSMPCKLHRTAGRNDFFASTRQCCHEDAGARGRVRVSKSRLCGTGNAAEAWDHQEMSLVHARGVDWVATPQTGSAPSGCGRSIERF